LQAGRTGRNAPDLAPAWMRDYLVEKRREPLDEDAISEYFPAPETVRGALAALERLFGLRLRPAGSSSEAWHPEAGLYEARDSDSDELLGTFYLDLYARPGKPERPEVFVLSRGRRLADGRYRPPACAVLAGWRPAAPGRPVRLRHGRQSDLEDFFHAMGHVLSVLLSRSKYGRCSGAAFSPDFAEAPALLLARLAWQPDIAIWISGRGGDPAQRLPAAWLGRAAQARAAGSSLGALEETAFALYDLLSHSGASPGDPGELYRGLFRRVAMLPVTSGTHPENADDRLVEEPGRAAARIIAGLAAEELWRRVKEDGLSNPIAGRRLRTLLLEPGAGRETASLRAYLDRRPSWRLVPEPSSWPSRPWDTEPREKTAAAGRRLLR
ncbi:MAG: M3 family metallopeptidase, partial [Elusimicrobia bacterium]|nr:M3 family metallopeptidase [Elusimicrobiota bacterium]